MTAGGNLVQAISFYPEQTQSKEILDAYVAQKEDLFKKVFSSKTMADGEASEQFLSFALRIISNQQISNERKQEVVTLAGQQMLKQIKDDPAGARTQLFFGSFLVNIGDAKNGIRYLDAARSLSSKKQQIIFEQIHAYYNLGDKKKALALAQEAYDLNPGVADAKKILEQLQTEK